MNRPSPDRPRFWTVAEVAAEMRVSDMTVYRLIHAGHMRAVRVGRSFRVPQDAVEEYLAEQLPGLGPFESHSRRDVG